MFPTGQNAMHISSRRIDRLDPERDSTVNDRPLGRLATRPVRGQVTREECFFERSGRAGAREFEWIAGRDARRPAEAVRSVQPSPWLVELIGFEPTTSGLQSPRSPS